jgi:hypothetical protein
MISIYDAVKERENQIAVFQAQCSGLQAEVDALRVAARILEGSNSGPVEAPRPMAVQSVQPVQHVQPVQPVQQVQQVQPVQSVQSVQPATATLGMEKKRVWP